MFWIVTCFMYPRVFTKEGSCGSYGDCCLSCDSSLYAGPTAPVINKLIMLAFELQLKL